MLKMNKLSRKLLVMVSLIVFISFGTAYLLHNYFSSDYYLYKMKNKVDSVYEEVKDLEIDELKKRENQIEKEHNVTIIVVNQTANIDDLNENFQFALYKDQVVLNKFWISEDSIQKMQDGKIVKKIFNQGKLKTSLLTVLYEKQNQYVLVGSVVVHNTDALKIINQLNFYAVLFGLVISLLLVAFFSRKIIMPLEQLKNVAKNIAKLDFKRVDIHTGDEIEELSHSINHMSDRLKEAHSQLEQQNRSLNTLISSISHEVKTPLALIQAYTIGMKDGLDDGTYGDIILEQVTYTSEMVDYIIKMSKYQDSEIKKEIFDLKELIQKVLAQYQIALQNRQLQVKGNTNNFESIWINEDRQQVEIVLHNLISNAIKYSEENSFDVLFTLEADKTIQIIIKNQTSTLTAVHMPHLLEPFYVVEESRNKDISGTGLGLSIVSTIINKNSWNYSMKLEQGFFQFSIIFNLEHPHS